MAVACSGWLHLSACSLRRCRIHPSTYDVPLTHLDGAEHEKCPLVADCPGRDGRTGRVRSRRTIARIGPRGVRRSDHGRRPRRQWPTRSVRRHRHRFIRTSHRRNDRLRVSPRASAGHRGRGSGGRLCPHFRTDRFLADHRRTLRPRTTVPQPSTSSTGAHRLRWLRRRRGDRCPDRRGARARGHRRDTSRLPRRRSHATVVRCLTG